MAQMFPADAEIFTTPGEALVYDFLKRAARPDTTHLVWYSPDIEDREPDFILLSPECGLIVIEVKDWVIDQILEMDPKTALLQIGNREERRDQPLAQARKYVNHLLSLLGKASQGSGRSARCPITWAAALPHISRTDWQKAGLTAIADEGRIFFWDELNEHSPLLRDASGAAFRNRLKNHFPPLFSFSLTNSDIDQLRNLIFPIVRIHSPRKDSRKPDPGQNLSVLDASQENAAKHLGSGNLLISGPAGSGKTLVLAARAAWLAATNKKIKRILVTCFNLSLAGYIRRLIGARSVSEIPHGVEILPFYMLCERIIGERLEHSSEGADYYTLIVEECLEQLSRNHKLKGYWDAILVDEGQDFSDEMAQVLLKLLPKDGLLTIAQDSAQKLYQKTEVNWQQFASLKSHTLERQYRNSGNISRYAANYLGESPPASIACPGSEPRLLTHNNMEAQIGEMARIISKKVAQGVQMSEIAILYFRSRYGDGFSLPEELIRALESRGVMARWLSRDASSKKFYDITTDSVTISTIHSAKGLDFAHVFLAGFEDQATPSYQRLAYVGMTRAREELTICKICG